MVAGIALLAMLTLYLLFPRQALIEQVRLEKGNDALTENYLTNLLRAEPFNHELRILLAEKRFALGQIAAAREVLEIAIAAPEPELRRRALLLDYRILSTVAARSGDDSTVRPEEIAAMRARLSALAVEQWGAAETMFLARQARRWQLPALAARLSARILSPDMAASADQLVELATEAVGYGDYVLASNLYFAARKRSADRDRQRELYLRGVATLQSGNLLREALAAADAQIGDLGDDEQTLKALARLALAANDPGRAQTYMKRLLHMSAVPASGVVAARAPQRSRGTELLAAFLSLLVSDARAQAAAVPVPASAKAASVTLRPYDEEIYMLAFDVFLANGNVADAWRVAEAAVTQRPDDMTWREKLAKSSEWSGKPDIALTQWLYMARKTAAQDAFKAILRLAPGLHDDEALLFAWKHEASRRKLARNEWRLMAETFENLGRPDDGIQYLEEQFKASADPVILDVLASLQERARRSDDAARSLERLMAVSGPNPDLAVRLATLLFLRSDFSKAYEMLKPLQERAAIDNAGYWKLLADLAWQLQEDDTAKTAYGALQRGGAAQEADLERLVALLRPLQPDEARRLALLSWRRFHSVSGVLVALEMASERRDFALMGQLLEEVPPDDSSSLQTTPYYFSLRASYFQGVGKPPLAIAELRKALSLAPTSADLRAALLWQLIDARELPGTKRELGARLREWNADASATTTYWDAYAAAWQVLGEPRRSLPWLTRQASSRGGDYIWLSNYADVLDEAGNTAMAWRIRRHAWALARQRLGNSAATVNTAPAATDKDRRDAMLAYARLATANAPGDAALSAMRRLLRQDSPASDKADSADDGDRRLDAAATELTLAWMLGEARYDAARQWMWTRYARRTSAPAWADYALALAERDWNRLEQLMAAGSDNVPAMSRIEAARATGRIAEAQTIGAQALSRAPDSDDLHLRLSTDLMATASSVIAGNTLFERGFLQGHEQTLRAQAWATPQLRIAAELQVFHQHTADPAALTGVPGTDRSMTVSALYRHGIDAGDGETDVALGNRYGLSGFTTARLRHTRLMTPRVTATAALSLRERATDTVPLQVAGHKDEASIGLQYGLSAREYLVSRLWSARFHSQQDSTLGTGQGGYFEGGYRIRSEYPDFSVRIARTISHYEAGTTADALIATVVPAGGTATASFFVPQSFRQWSINAGFGTTLREDRSRALRPFMDIGRSVNSASGSGYNWLFGAGGSVVGPDHVSLYWLRSKGGGGANVTVREMGLRYQYFFD